MNECRDSIKPRDAEGTGRMFSCEVSLKPHPGMELMMMLMIMIAFLNVTSHWKLGYLLN